MGKNLFRENGRTLKGSVLFTVLCVMAVVLILMITTIGLASTASRRAYSEYYDTQIAATGKSVISSVLKSIEPNEGPNKDLGKTIYEAVGSEGEYTLHLANNGNLGNGLGRVESIVFTKAGVNSINDYYISGDSDYMIMKVTATITMGGKTTTYTEYATDVVNVPGKNGGNGGLLSTSGVSTTGTGMNILGPFGGGFKDCIRPSKSAELQLKDPGGYSGVQFFNDSVWVNTAKAFIYDMNNPSASYSDEDIKKADYQGITVLGNVRLTNNKAYWVSKSDTNEMKNQPYIFLTGKLDFSQATEVFIGTRTINQGEDVLELSDDDAEKELNKKLAGHKVNIYCGTIDINAQGGLQINGDVYCYNDSSSVVNILGGGDNKTLLLAWIEKQKKDGELVTLEPYVDDKGETQYNKLAGNSLVGDLHCNTNLKIKQTNLGICGDIYVNGNLDIQEIVNARMQDKLPTIMSGKKIYCNTVIPSNYKDVMDEPNVKQTYKDFVNAIVVDSSKTKISDDYSLEKILGIKFNNSSASVSDKLIAIDKGNYTLDGADLSKKIVQNPKEMKLKYYDVTKDSEGNEKWTVKGSRNKSGVAKGSPEYNGVVNVKDSKDNVIREQCTLKGSFSDQTINIEASFDSELCILLDGVTLNQSEIVVDETPRKDAEGNLEKPYPVSFYIADDSKLTLNTGSRIITKFYKEKYFGTIAESNKLNNPITIDNTQKVPVEYVPGIYIYGNNDDSVSGKEEIIIQNYGIITGYIIAPRASLKAYNCGSPGEPVTYNGVKYTDITVGMIGSAIVGPIAEAQNDFTLLYVNNSDDGETVPPQEWFAYNKIYGFTNY